MSASTSGTLSATGSVTLAKPQTDTLAHVQLSGEYGTVTGVVEGTLDGTNFFPLAATLMSTGAVVSGTLSPADNATLLYTAPCPGCAGVRFRATAIASGTLAVAITSAAYASVPGVGNQTSGNTFSGATFNGTASAFSTMFTVPTATVAAAGTNQATAAALTTGFTLVSGADDTKGVVLPAAAAGLVCVIKVGDGADLKVYPATGDAINALSANAALTVVDDVCFALFALDGTTWYSMPLLPS